MTASTNVRGTLVPMLFLLAVMAIAGMMILGPGISTGTGRKPIQLPATPLSEAEEEELKKALEWANDTFKQPPAADVKEQVEAVYSWLGEANAEVSAGLKINAHALKHNGETEKIYKLLLEGKCTATGSFCRNGDADKLYVCVDPVTGAVGAIIVTLKEEILTGYFESRKGYWYEEAKQNWRSCK